MMAQLQSGFAAPPRGLNASGPAQSTPRHLLMLRLGS